MIETTDTAQIERAVVQGAGQCSSSGCNCKSFSGNADTCANCGHNYQTHW